MQKAESLAEAGGAVRDQRLVHATQQQQIGSRDAHWKEDDGDGSEDADRDQLLWIGAVNVVVGLQKLVAGYLTQAL
jgi:hypothetical protein